MMLLPPNAGPLERALEAATARLGAVPSPIEPLWDPDRCPVVLLPYLAWALSIDVWDPDWPEDVKRARVRRAIEIQRAKGTVRSVRDVVAAFGGSIALREWWETTPRGDPHTFALTLSLSGAAGSAPSAAYVDQVIADISRTKPVRSHFTFTLSVDSTGAVGLIAALRPAIHARLNAGAGAA